MQKKNIVVFFTDQQRADTCGCYGQPSPTTPRLDRFAEHATVYDHAYTCQPVCGPARAAIQSGVYPTKLGCYKNGVALPEDIPTLAKALEKNGYHTAYVGKWHLATTSGKFNCEKTAIPRNKQGGYRDFWAADVLEFTSHGYDGYIFDKDGNKLDFKGYRADCITDYALDFLETCKKEEPFFLFLSHIEPHHQNDRGHYEGPEGSKTRFADYTPPIDLARAKGGNWREEYPDYLGAVERLDYNFGRVLDTLAKKDLLEDTVVFFTSDHGSHFKTRNLEYKRSCHDASIHIPFVVGGGAFQDGGRNARIVSLLDLPATILGIAGADDFATDGENLLTPPERDAAYIQISESHVGRALRTERFTYEVIARGKIGYLTGSSKVYREAFLYDNQEDPAQQKNLIGDRKYADVRASLRKQMLQCIKHYEGCSAKIKPKRLLGRF